MYIRFCKNIDIYRKKWFVQMDVAGTFVHKMILFTFFPGYVKAY